MPKDKKVAPGNDINLQVNFEGTPRPTIKWTKDGKRIPSKAVIKEGGTSAELRIKSSVLTDTGIYQISLKNDAGKVKASCNVVVHGKFACLFSSTTSHMPTFYTTKLLIPLPCVENTVQPYTLNETDWHP